MYGCRFAGEVSCTVFAVGAMKTISFSLAIVDTAGASADVAVERNGSGRPHAAAEAHISAWADWALGEAHISTRSPQVGSPLVAQTPITLVKEVRR